MSRWAGGNAFKLGVFAANCSSGRCMTTVPERWSGSWADNERLARIADDAGIDFLLPIGRWKGYGGSTDYQGSTYETITWATGLLACTERITVFGTVHVPLFHPLIAAKQMVTADHVGRGRFALNVVCGWNEGEFAMFGVDPHDQPGRYRQGQEWLDVVRAAWTRDDFDFSGEFYALHGVREKPKPYGGTMPVTMNAGQSTEGRAFALRNCDAFFTSMKFSDGLERITADVRRVREEGRRWNREVQVFTNGFVVCRPTAREAEAYHHYVFEENVDWGAVDGYMAMRDLSGVSDPEKARMRAGYAKGLVGATMVGDPDTVATRLADMSSVGLAGAAISFVNDADELPYFAAEVLPRLQRLGLRA
jgi:alkanesulfonate monooxygenase SsuD/methylene tetrahydromethanopterin reductase-like flavin-dependent oxidoreductase (luciferase family)